MNHLDVQEPLVESPFQDAKLLVNAWGQRWGFPNPVDRVEKVLVHRPGHEVLYLHGKGYKVEAGPVVLQNIIGYDNESERNQVHLEILQAQHDELTATLRKEGAEVIELLPQDDHYPDRVFTRDLGMVVPGGIILSRFALHVRYGETQAATQAAARLGMPILGMIQADGHVEGGSFTFIHDKLALVGRSERVNDAGIRQLRQLLALQEIELLVVDLPANLIHLDEAFVMVDRDMALINMQILPYWLLEKLQQLDIRLVQVDPRDPPLTVNCLAVAPGRVIFPKDGVRTSERLAKQGIELLPVNVSELVKLGGGIHCATLPLIRASE